MSQLMQSPHPSVTNTETLSPEGGTVDVTAQVYLRGDGVALSKGLRSSTWKRNCCAEPRGTKNQEADAKGRPSPSVERAALGSNALFVTDAV